MQTMRPRGIALIESKQSIEKRIDNPMLASGMDKQNVDEDTVIVRKINAKDMALDKVKQHRACPF